MTTFNGRIPLFNGSNYSTWKTQMEAILHKNRLLNIVLGVEKAPKVEDMPQTATSEQRINHDAQMDALQKFNEKDMDARAEILISLEANIVNMVKNIKSSKEMWNHLQDTFDRKSTRKKVEGYRKLLNIKMSDNQSVAEFIIEFDVCVSSIREMGAELDEDLLAVIIIDALPEKFSAIKAAIDTANEFPKVSVLKARLLEIGDKEEPNQDSAMKVKHYSKRQQQISPNFNRNQDEGMYKKAFKCYRCKRKGHKAKDCRAKLSVECNTRSGDEKASLLGVVETALSVKSSRDWVIDSGASSHMCNEKSLFIEINENYEGKVKLADDKEVDIKGIGRVAIDVVVGGKKKPIHFDKTLYVPDLKHNLVSTSKTTDSGCKVLMEGNRALISRKGEVLIEGYKHDNIYIVDLYKDKILANSVKKCDEKDFKLWHGRYGHLNSRDLKKLSLCGMVNGLPNIKSYEIDCVTCIRGKQTRLPFPRKNEKSSTEILQLVHTDLCGPMKSESMAGSLYFATFIDDFSRKVFVYFLRHKSQYLDKFKEFKISVENETGKRIKILRSDNAKELVSEQFSKFLKDNGIKRQLTVEYTPQQNGIAERMNRTLIEMGRCYMLESDIPCFLWAEIINASAYIRNRCPTNLNNMKTPEELWTGKKPCVKHLRQIGCKAYVLNKRSKSKWEARSDEYILVGYSNESKAYRLWKPGTNSIVKSRDVRFIESELYKNECRERKNEYFYDFEIKSLQESENVEPQDTDESDEELLDCDDVEENAETHPFSENVNSQTDENMIQIPGESIKQRLRSWAFGKNNESTNMSTENMMDPKSIKEALTSQHADEWYKAIEEEYTSLINNKTWTLTDLPEGRTAVGCRWVFKSKVRPDGTIEKRKARLVAKGYTQVMGLDYVDTFAPVVRQESLRLIYALSVELDLQLRQLDVSTAFLNGTLDEEIYMEQPEMFVQEATKQKVCKLHKAIYGLKQSGRQWFKCIDAVFKEFGLNQSKYDQCIYYVNNENALMIVGLYVDDILIACNNKRFTEKFVKSLHSKFEIRNIGIPKHCVGLEVNVKPGEVSISQSGYIKRLARKYGLEKCKPVKIPMPANTKLEKEPSIAGENEKVNDKLYQELIGYLLYISLHSRPDISCAVNMLSQFSKYPCKQHYNAALQVLKYLNTTNNAVISYKKCGTPLTGFCDANWAQDVNDRKSQSGFCFLLANGVISWQSKKQQVVATSSAEAEYVALSEAAKEASYLSYILNELGLSYSKPITINTDSQSAQQMAKFGSHHSRTKHIHYKYHFIKDTIENGIVELRYLPTTEMIADVFTKPVPRPKHIFCCNNIGIVFNC